MQSYIVRVYRRDPDNKSEVVGIVEKVGEQHKNTFMNLSELRESLEQFITLDDSEYSAYSEAKQTDMFGHHGIPQNH